MVYEKNKFDRFHFSLCVYQHSNAEYVCTIKVNQEFIDVAIKDIVRIGSYDYSLNSSGRCRHLGGRLSAPPCINPFPYHSVQEFKDVNPNCCKLLPSVPGGFPPEASRKLSNKRDGKKRLVELVFRAVSKDRAGKIYSYQHKSLKIVSCLGVVVDLK
jgi:hypothetical protein